MKRYRVTVRPADGPAWHFTGIFHHPMDAIDHALELTEGRPARISVDVVLVSGNWLSIRAAANPMDSTESIKHEDHHASPA